MVITDETIQVDRTSSNTPSNAPPRWPFRRLLGIGTAIVVAAIALVVIVESSLVSARSWRHCCDGGSGAAWSVDAEQVGQPAHDEGTVGADPADVADDLVATRC